MLCETIVSAAAGLCGERWDAMGMFAVMAGARRGRINTAITLTVGYAVWA